MGGMSSSPCWSTQQFLRATSPEPLNLICPLPSLDPFKLYVQLTRCSRFSFLLESGGGNPQLAQYSFIGCDPYQIFSAKGSSYEIKSGNTKVQGRGDTFSVLAKLLASSPYERMPNFPPFLGGAVGYVSYDMVRQFEHLPELAVADLQLPDMYFLFVDILAAIDHVNQTLHFMFAPDPKRWISESRDQLAREGKERLLEWQAKLTTSAKSIDLECRFPFVSMPSYSESAVTGRVHRASEEMSGIDRGRRYLSSKSFTSIQD